MQRHSGDAGGAQRNASAHTDMQRRNNSEDTQKHTDTQRRSITRRDTQRQTETRKDKYGTH
eukprot:7750243-Lingulodinium_polyedra.AAC.1